MMNDAVPLQRAASAGAYRRPFSTPQDIYPPTEVPFDNASAQLTCQSYYMNGGNYMHCLVQRVIN